MQNHPRLQSPISNPAGDQRTDRELLKQLVDFLNKRSFIHGDEASIRDMVIRYANPPFTLVNRAAMRMTVGELNYLNTLMEKINQHLQSTSHNEAQPADEQ